MARDRARAAGRELLDPAGEDGVLDASMDPSLQVGNQAQYVIEWGRVGGSTIRFEPAMFTHAPESIVNEVVRAYEEVRLGRFRNDLYFRLKVVSIMLPPLRDREGDVALLSRHFNEWEAEGARLFHHQWNRLGPQPAIDRDGVDRAGRPAGGAWLRRWPSTPTR